MPNDSNARKLYQAGRPKNQSLPSDKPKPSGQFSPERAAAVSERRSAVDALMAKLGSMRGAPGMSGPGAGSQMDEHWSAMLSRIRGTPSSSGAELQKIGYGANDPDLAAIQRRLSSAEGTPEWQAHSREMAEGTLQPIERALGSAQMDIPLMMGANRRAGVDPSQNEQLQSAFTAQRDAAKLAAAKAGRPLFGGESQGAAQGKPDQAPAPAVAPGVRGPDAQPSGPSPGMRGAFGPSGRGVGAPNVGGGAGEANAKGPGGASAHYDELVKRLSQRAFAEPNNGILEAIAVALSGLVGGWQGQPGLGMQFAEKVSGRGDRESAEQQLMSLIGHEQSNALKSQGQEMDLAAQLSRQASGGDPESVETNRRLDAYRKFVGADPDLGAMDDELDMLRGQQMLTEEQAKRALDLIQQKRGRRQEFSKRYGVNQ